MNITTLPIEITQIIYDYIPFTKAVICSRTCKQFYYHLYNNKYRNVQINFFQRKIRKKKHITEELLYQCAHKGYKELIEIIIQKTTYNDWNTAMCHAASGGHKNIIEYFIEKGANNWNSGLNSVIFNPYRYQPYIVRKELIIMFLAKGADNLNMAMYFAAREGDKQLIEYCIYKGANDCDTAMIAAGNNGHIELVKFFVERGGVKDLNDAMKFAVIAGDHKLVEYCVEKGANDWNKGLEGVGKGGHKEFAEYFINKGATDFNAAMYTSACRGDKELVKYFVQKGANDWNGGLLEAAYGRHENLIKWFIKKGANDLRRAVIAATESYGIRSQDTLVDWLEQAILQTSSIQK